MPLITFQDVDYSVGGPLLLEAVNLSIEPNERIALIGRNGAGKSTLLRLLAGELHPDDGDIRVQAGVRIARLEQEVPDGTRGTVFDVVTDGLGELGGWLASFHRLSQTEPVDAQALADVQEKIERAGGWAMDQRVVETLDRLELDGSLDFETLSGGLKRRVLLARSVVCAPDLLLLDEPTNHLDIEAIEQLQRMLLNFSGSLVFVTHDRRFLRSLATRIVEIDRGSLSSWPGDWENYLRRREERAHAQAQEQARFDRALAQEEIWIRQGIKARRTRNEGRVRRLEAMRSERAQRRERTGTVRMELAAAPASGRKVIEAIGLCFGYAGRPLVREFDTTIQRGDRIGLIGANGSGKTTLLRLLLGELAPDAGEVRVGSQLQIAYFDQYRHSLREEWNALDNVAQGQEFIEIGGRRKHIVGYLQDFLFSPERARAPITRLSGGERNRLLLARLFAQPSNLLVMDEPTNDLDVETLELLEELLADYAGTVLLVSHDRDFLDQVVTSTLVMEGDGRVGEYVGGYSDWLRQRALVSAESPSAEQRPAKAVADARPAEPARRKLGYKEARELAQLPARIESLEADLEAGHAELMDPAFYQRDSAEIASHRARIEAMQTELASAYERWQQLEEASG